MLSFIALSVKFSRLSRESTACSRPLRSATETICACTMIISMVMQPSTATDHTCIVYISYKDTWNAPFSLMVWLCIYLAASCVYSSSTTSLPDASQFTVYYVGAILFALMLSMMVLNCIVIRLSTLICRLMAGLVKYVPILA